MDNFIRVKEYLDKQLKENCDDLEKFVLELVYHHKQLPVNPELSEDDVNNFYVAAGEKVKSEFKKDCDVFYNSKSSSENFSDLVSSIYFRGREKIDTFTKNKFTSFLVYNFLEGGVDKNTLLKWLSGKDKMSGN